MRRFLLYALLVLQFFFLSRVKSAVILDFSSADKAFKERGEEQKAREALKNYRKYFAEKPESRETGWRLAMACQFVGMRLTPKDDDKKVIFAEGKEAGLTALAIDPNCAPCHFWTAIDMAAYGETVGPFKMLFSLKEIEKHLKESIALDPSYAMGGAYRVLGLIQEKLPGILGGSNDDARDYFEKAVLAAPEEPLNYLFLSKLLINEYGEKEKAQKLIANALSFPPPPAAHIESIEARQELMSLSRAE